VVSGVLPGSGGQVSSIALDFRHLSRGGGWRADCYGMPGGFAVARTERGSAVTGFGMFQTSVLGMQSQSQALQVISGNIANVTTTGFKRSDVDFATLMSGAVKSESATEGDTGPLSTQSDIGGVTAFVLNRVSEQGEISASGAPLDLAISGTGFLVFRQGQDATTGLVYGRDGRLQRAVGPEMTVPGNAGQPTVVNQSYLADKNGNLLQGWAAAADGSFPTDPAALTSVRVDPYAFTSSGQATTEVTLPANLPANADVGSAESLSLTVYDATAQVHSVECGFVKTAANTWALTLTGEPGDQITLQPADPLTFRPDGRIEEPQVRTVSITHAGGATSTFALDLSRMSQFAASFTTGGPESDGYPSGTLQGVEFDRQGYMLGSFSNGHTERLYRLPIADFANADGLTPLEGNVYAASDTSGLPQFNGAGESGSGWVTPGAVELSTVDIADQFSRMMVTQQAYNSSATAFRTLDELSQTARDLKR
jgi:flagellar hook protein FlgE